MFRKDAIALIKSKVQNRNLVNHMIAVGAIMRKLAEERGEDADLWEITGILHDIDFEETKDNFQLHASVSADMLQTHLPEAALHAIRAHNFEYSEVNPNSALDYGLLCADALSGLIVACALVMPSKHVADLKVKSIRKKFKTKDFARAVSRERVDYCAKLNIDREHFFELGLTALQSISEEIGL
jgi:putative nucleotidyltransferase with HDIG domain